MTLINATSSEVIEKLTNFLKNDSEIAYKSTELFGKVFSLQVGLDHEDLPGKNKCPCVVIKSIPRTENTLQQSNISYQALISIVAYDESSEVLEEVLATGVKVYKYQAFVDVEKFREFIEYKIMAESGISDIVRNFSGTQSETLKPLWISETGIDFTFKQNFRRGI